MHSHCGLASAGAAAQRGTRAHRRLGLRAPAGSTSLFQHPLSRLNCVFSDVAAELPNKQAGSSGMLFVGNGKVDLGLCNWCLNLPNTPAARLNLLQVCPAFLVAGSSPLDEGLTPSARSGSALSVKSELFTLGSAEPPVANGNGGLGRGRNNYP